MSRIVVSLILSAILTASGATDVRGQGRSRGTERGPRQTTTDRINADTASVQIQAVPMRKTFKAPAKKHRKVVIVPAPPPPGPDVPPPPPRP